MAGNKLQPVDVLKGARDASPYKDVIRPSPYRSEGAMKPFTGDLAEMGTLQRALEVSGTCACIASFPTQFGGKGRSLAFTASCHNSMEEALSWAFSVSSKYRCPLCAIRRTREETIFQYKGKPHHQGEGPSVQSTSITAA